jgi:hypothetical protein
MPAARAADHLDGDDRVAAQLEEVVVQADLRAAQHLAPQRGDALLTLVALGGGRAARLRLRLRQGRRSSLPLAVNGNAASASTWAGTCGPESRSRR